MRCQPAGQGHRIDGQGSALSLTMQTLPRRRVQVLFPGGVLRRQHMLESRCIGCQNMRAVCRDRDMKNIVGQYIDR